MAILTFETKSLDDRSQPVATVERAERVHQPVATDDGPRAAIDALIRAHRPRSG